MNAQNAIEYIHSLSKFGKKSGLDNIKLLLDKMGNPQNDLKFVHIAGTNGKGSIARYISEALIDSGLKVGLYTSPYIEKFNERIQINNENISDEDLVDLVKSVKGKVEEINEDDYYPIEFEVITAMGFKYFKDQKCDIVVLETGLGGRLDCTNIIENPLVCVIGAIGFDHTKYLGETLHEIAFEKCGIIKDNSYVVLYPKMAEIAEQVARMVALKTGSMINKSHSLNIKEINEKGTIFTYNNSDYHIKMIGEHQVYNSICAIETLKYLRRYFNITEENIKNGLSNASWKCRFERLGKNKDVIIDGAHNYHAIKEFSKTVKMCFDNKKKIVIMGMLEEKDYEKCVREVALVADNLIITKVITNRANDATKIYNEAKKYKHNVVYFEDNEEAMDFASLIKSDDCNVFVVGSLYLAGNLRGLVDKFF